MKRFSRAYQDSDEDRSSRPSYSRRKSSSSSRSRSRSKSYKRHRSPSNERRDFRVEMHKYDFTCVMHNLPLDVKEFDVFAFFKKKCGKIADIKFLKGREGKCKGMCYVEFEKKESVSLAEEMSGQYLRDNIIRVEPYDPTKYEKSKHNNNNKKSKYNLNDKEKNKTQLARVYVGGLTEHLAELKENDLKELFQTFGEIDYVDLHKDPITGQNKGYAFIQFKNPKDAKIAIEKMNGFAIGNKNLKVSTVQSNLAGTINSVHNYINSESLDLDDESGHNFLHNSQSRALLMQKLTRENPTNVYSNSHIQHPTLNLNKNGLLDSYLKDEVSANPTCCLLLANLFTKDEILKNNANFLSDLKNEVLDECKNFGDVKNVFIDPAGAGGYVFVKFLSPAPAQIAQKTLNDRYFAGRKISVFFIRDEYFKKRFST